MDPKQFRLDCYNLFSKGISPATIFPKSLAGLPKETLLVLLKYGYPEIVNGDLFFVPLLGREDVDWLLDLCVARQINLNWINQSTAMTVLEMAVSDGNLPLVLTFLRYRVDPNVGDPMGIALNLFNYADAYGNYPVYLEILKQLRRYGARLGAAELGTARLDQKQIKDKKILRALQSGTYLKPEYAPDKSGYLLNDNVEDIAVITLPRKKSIFPWPYYID